MKAPKFWKRKNIIAYLLLPLSYLYRLASGVYHFLERPRKLSRPVICVGNIIAGGAGKTPIAIEIGMMLKELHAEFVYLSRGYGGSIGEFTMVNPRRHNASEAGDEPLLLSEISEVYLSKNRLSGAIKISKQHDQRIIVLDDGLQDNRLFKDFSIVVIDGIYGFGNGFFIPSGPLRESVKKGIGKADLVIIIGADKTRIKNIYPNKKIITARIKPINHNELLGKKLIAFCGIGRPDKFFETLHSIKCNVIKNISYPDHYPYQARDIDEMLEMAHESKAQLVTTKKDWVRLSRKHQDMVKYLDIRIEFTEKDRVYLISQLKNLIDGKNPRKQAVMRQIKSLW